MDLKKLFSMQKKLDQNISENSDRLLSKDDLLTSKLLAIIVEVCELANETRCFKFWSKRRGKDRKKKLIEYVDILHFFLSIGNTLGFSHEEVEQAYYEKYEINLKRQEENY